MKYVLPHAYLIVLPDTFGEQYFMFDSRLRSGDVIIGPEMVKVQREIHHPPLPNECPCTRGHRDEL